MNPPVPTAKYASPASLQYAIRLHRGGRLDRAAALYERILRADSRQSDALHLLGLIAYQRGDDAAAGARFQAAIAVRPDVAEFYHSIGNAWRRQGRRTEAVAAYLRAAELDRHYFDALYSLGSLLCELLRPDEGSRALRLAVTLRPDHADTRLFLGLCLERLGQLDAAVEQYIAALSLRADDPRAYLLLGGALFKTGHAVEADLAFGRSLTLDPNQPTAQSRRIAALNYRADLSAREVAAAHLEWGRRHADPLLPKSTRQGQAPALPGGAPPAAERPLRVGYVSPNFYRHSVSHFMLPLLRNHDRTQFEVFCYSNSAVVDETTQAVRATADHWRPIQGQSDEAVADRICADGIDILVDLAGHTGDNRLLTFARRPAPVQVSWLGYPQTTGLAAMDYRLSDAIVEPSGDADILSSETVVRLPNGFHCFGRPGDGSPGDGCEGDPLEIGPLPALANGFVTFGSFNTIQKMPPALVTLWARVLERVPGSRLLLKSLPDAVIADRYQTMFAAEGIDPARVEFLHWTQSRREHLQLYSRMDIALDAFPYNGTTTTCEALWMGVPVLSLCGDRHVSRVGASLLTRVGLSDWIVDDEDAYVEVAVNMANNPHELSHLRSTLRERMRASALCDAVGFAREIEAAFLRMWQARQK